MHILVLADRDWTHPEAGGSGHNLRRQVERFLERGHRVSVIAAGYRGCRPRELIDGVELRRVGGRSTVFPAAIVTVLRGFAADADVVLEVINGITFLTPLWLRRPHVALVHHVHAGPHYVEEMGSLGRLVGALLESLPLRWLYRSTNFVCASRSTRAGLAALGIPRQQIAIGYNGVDAELFSEPRRSEEPTFVVLGRIKRYKRIELVLEVLAQIPGVRLEIVGDGSHREPILSAVRRLRLQQRVNLRGYVDASTKRELLRSAWANVTASAAEGWGLTIAEAAACGTPSVGLATGGLREAIVDEQTGLLAGDTSELRRQLVRLAADRELVERLGAGARERARELTWERTADVTLNALRSELKNAAQVAPTALSPAGLQRVRRLWRLWRRERIEPMPFYRLLAVELADSLQRRHGLLAGRVLLDLGCGPGAYTEALRARGAKVLAVDNDREALSLGGGFVPGAILADAAALPLPDASVDGVVCSNLLEHTPDPELVLREIARVLSPGGFAYISWTNWYSLWGGHEFSPYQWLGPGLGPRLHDRLHGAVRKNAYGDGLWYTHIGRTLAFVRDLQTLQIDRVEPRYWPRLGFIVTIPVVREVLTWNCVIHAHRV